MKKALLLIDIQNDYFPSGRMPLEKSIEASLKAQNMLTAFRAEELPVIHIQHISTQADATFFLPCTKGIEFHPNVQPAKNESIIKKHYPNSFRDTSLLTYLHKAHIHQLVIVGMMTHQCIDATTRAAYDLGFTCKIIHDACATSTLRFGNTLIPAQTVHQVSLAALQSTYATLQSTEEYLQHFSVATTL